ncbi:MAG: DUF817 domain-containing protein [Rhodobacteraceae bacterium]|nr:DUF817 domain-containing protein [Paracoccaceae bacterium]
MARRHLPHALAEFIMFGLKMAWASLFAGVMLGAIIITALVWPENAPLARYDFLVVFALVSQALFLVLRLESWREAKVILLFHICGTVMEIFKLHMGSWGYPEPGLLKIAGVPLFSGFMYASVGSFIARAIRIFDMRFERFPPFWLTIVLAVAIYANFFTHHFVWDVRYGLMAATVLLYWRTRIYFTPFGAQLWMPLAFAAFLASLFLYLAENIGTITGTWLYAGATGFSFTSIAKLGSWYLLLFVSFSQVTLIYRHVLRR